MAINYSINNGEIELDFNLAITTLADSISFDDSYADLAKLKILNDYNNTQILKKTLENVIGYDGSLNYDGSDLTKEAGNLISRMKKSSDVLSVLLERIENENDLSNIQQIPQIVRAVKELTLRIDYMNKKAEINIESALSGTKINTEEELANEVPNLVNAVSKSGGDIIHQILEMDNTTSDNGPGELY